MLIVFVFEGVDFGIGWEGLWVYFFGILCYCGVGLFGYVVVFFDEFRCLFEYVEYILSD